MSKKSVQEYLAEYQKIHVGEGDVLFKGKLYRVTNLFDGSNFTNKLFDEFKSRVDQFDRAVRILDYGCGKAKHLTENRIAGQTLYQHLKPETIQAYWCYDPGFAKFAGKPPKQSFDIVICADVMEHVPEEEVVKTLTEIGSMISGKGHILFTISCKPAIKQFADGENLHITVKDPEWWVEQINKSISRKNLFVIFETEDGEKTWTKEV